ncbi:Chondroitin sulfate proteoglycan 5 [Saguinus oedipus]|uniref:Chondroitin sulfate proteoglycan 5 n=1 Tax=Saguinus oedipus TaxID=9490 RepID=A0ABQ9U219_SAGOE|nr:Chondroitin sulfate proteoglycan 5 [Saguinus oedipus]
MLGSGEDSGTDSGTGLRGRLGERAGPGLEGSPARRPDTPPLALLPAAREAGSAVEAEELMKGSPAWEPRANDTREEAGPPAAGEDEASWTAPGGKLAGPEEALQASTARLTAQA